MAACSVGAGLTASDATVRSAGDLLNPLQLLCNYDETSVSARGRVVAEQRGLLEVELRGSYL